MTDVPETVHVEHGRALRLDIEGMRALAVGAVLAFHSGLPWFPGGFVGVDVFFVLSGFLITGLLSREMSTTGHLRVFGFWGRRVRRLLPASATVLVFSAFVTWVYLPITQRQDFGGDIVSAALYVVNWRLADRSVDYLAEDVGSSPVQHFWSLSVEEQFYLLWPILLLIVAVLWRKHWQRSSLAVLGLVTAASFAWSVDQSHTHPATAFFVSTTRIWELGVGALLALSHAQVTRLPAAVRAVGGWLGLAAIAYAVLFFDGATRWPGLPAAVPVLGAALVVASGITRTPGGPQRLLSVAPLVWTGGLSYSIYLWHWPILVAAQARYPDLQLRWMVLLTVLSLLPAWLSNQLIENPIRFGAAWRPGRRVLVLGLSLTTLGVGAGLALNASVGLGDVVHEASRSQSPGASAIADPANRDVNWSAIRSVARMRPLPTEATSDRPASYDNGSGCEVPAGTAKPKVCVYGDKDAQRTVAIVGDSKIAQWQTALSVIGKHEGWRLVSITKNHCPFTDAALTGAGGVEHDCREWGRAALAILLRMKPDTVLTSQRFSTALPPGTTQHDDRTTRAMRDGLESYWGQLTGAGIPVVPVLDNPTPTTAPVYECVAEHLKDLAACSFSRAAGVKGSAGPVLREAAARVPGVEVIDMSDTICPDGPRCAPVIGNVLVYRQGSHLTMTYVDSMVPQLSAELHRATHGAFGHPRS